MTGLRDQDAMVVAPVDAEMEPAEFEAIASYAKSAFGLHLPQTKREMVFARLIKRLRVAGITSFSAYLDHIQKASNKEERGEFLSALTTNVTQFFREPHHFEYLRQTLLPHLIQSARAKGRVRIWSAGCSAGQEAYSLAMVLNAAYPDIKNLDFKILATDIDSKILERARIGVYPMEELAAIPETMRKDGINLSDNTTFSITKPVRDLVTFAELNLIEEWPMRGKFDAIFCRNVAIYFDQPTQAKLWRRFCDAMTDKGHLMIGHSERISGPASYLLKSVGITIYARNSEIS